MQHEEAIAIRVRHLQGAPVDAQELDAALATIQAAASQKPRKDPWGLTRMEREVLQMIADGEAQTHIAAKLALHVKGINTHIRNARRKMMARSSAQAAVLWDRFLR